MTSSNRCAEMLLAIEMLMNTRIISKDIETLIDTLATMKQTGAPPTAPLRTMPSGQQCADVFPRGLADSNGPVPAPRTATMATATAIR